MDTMHKDTAGEISKMLTTERVDIEQKLAQKQKELLETRRRFTDMGFRTDSKTLHPTVQTAVAFSESLTAVQKQKVECEALLATIRTAILKGEDLGQYMMSVGDSVGREMLMNSLGLGSRDANTQSSLEHDLVAARAELQTIQQNLGPNHPEVIALAEKARQIELFLGSTDERIKQHVRACADQRVGTVAGANGAAEARRSDAKREHPEKLL